MLDQLNGILVIDKPAGMSSARVVHRVKQTVGAKKVGHTGTLDPFATGNLVICLNQATKIARFLIDGDKTYEAVMHLGIETDTQDVTGQAIAQCCLDENGREDFTDDRIKQVMAGFVGPIQQMPPVFSALKHKGVPLYKLARQGTPVQKPARQVTIYELKDIRIDFPLVRFTTTCSTGTYIRTLCADMGRKLGCGAHLKSLRRVACCGFTIADAITLDEMERLQVEGTLAAHLVSLDRALGSMPSVTVSKILGSKIKLGNPISAMELRGNTHVAGQEPDELFFKVKDHNHELIAILKDEQNEKMAYCCVFNT